MTTKDDRTRATIDKMVKDYVDTGRKGGIAIVSEERVRKHVEGVVERAEKKRELGEFRNKK